MTDLPTLDAHAHLRPACSPVEVSACGAVLAMSLSLEEASRSAGRKDPFVAWGAGCHPRIPAAQAAFDQLEFRRLAEKSAIVGEIGLDRGARVPLDKQLCTFRQALEALADLPRLVSIHSYQSTALMLEELGHHPLVAPVLHWWTGSAQETRRAVELGCYFSIHSQVARHSKFHSWVPIERVLVESDHGYNDPPPAIPLRVGWVEYLVAQQYRIEVDELRRTVWRNFGEIIDRTGTLSLLPQGIQETLLRMKAEGG